MNASSRTRVAVNGYGVIGKRVADAVASQDDMELVGIADIETDWRWVKERRCSLSRHSTTLEPGMQRSWAKSPDTERPSIGII